MPQVSAVLGGVWKQHPMGRACRYVSDHGRELVSAEVDRAGRALLQVARAQCVPGVEPGSATRADFVCLQRAPTGDQVLGSTVARGRLWVVVMEPTAGGNHHPELAAMRALMNAVTPSR